MKNRKIALYSAVGPELTRYDVDVAKLALTRRETITAPSNVQYVWPHPTRKYLYLISSPRGPGEAARRAGITFWLHTGSIRKPVRWRCMVRRSR